LETCYHDYVNRLLKIANCLNLACWVADKIVIDTNTAGHSSVTIGAEACQYCSNLAPAQAHAV
jgi:hypothetical protein